MSDIFKPTKMEDEELLTLADLVSQFEDHETKIKEIEELLKEEKEELIALSRGAIPALLNETGFSEIKLKNGRKVIIKDQVKASIAQASIDKAFKGMVEEHIKATGQTEDTSREIVGSLFTKEAVIKDPTKQQIELLLNHGIVFDHKRSIHWATLAKYCKEVMERGAELPEGISAYTYQETKVK